MGKIGSVAKSANKFSRLGMKLTVRGALVFGIGASLIAANGNTEKAGDISRSVIANDVAPAVASALGGAASYLALDTLDKDDLPYVGLSSGESTNSQLGSLAVLVSGIDCVEGTYSLDKGSLGVYDRANLTPQEAYDALEQHPEIQAAAAKGAPTVDLSCI